MGDHTTLILPPWVFFAVPTVFTLATLIMGYFSLRQKTDDRSFQALTSATESRIKGLEREIDLANKEIAQLKDAHRRCQDELSQSSKDNLALLRQLFSREPQ